ncbi:MAG TPA: GNAT family N-acetyltransferase [Crinalium sp.]
MAIAPPFTLRPVTSADESFLFSLYASTRAEELAVLGWDAAMQDNFLRMQFRAQQMGYRAQFPNSDRYIVVANPDPVGSAWVDRRPDEIRLVDLALLPDVRNQGIGTQILQDLIAEAAIAHLPFRLQVVKGNRAIHLYNRLGGKQIGETDTHIHMEWL